MTQSGPRNTAQRVEHITAHPPRFAAYRFQVVSTCVMVSKRCHSSILRENDVNSCSCTIIPRGGYITAKMVAEGKGCDFRVSIRPKMDMGT